MSLLGAKMENRQTILEYRSAGSGGHPEIGLQFG